MSTERTGIRRAILPISIGLIVVLALLYASPSTALRTNTIALDPCLGHETTARQAAPFIEQVWRLIRWEREKPKLSTVRAYRERLRCAGPENRKVLKERWREAKRAFYKHRRAELWRVRVTPFYGCTSIGGCGWWPLPAPIVDCESGGYYGHHSGAFGFLDSTWLSRGGGEYAPYPGAASKRAQQVMAHQLWLEVGEAAWECKADGAPHPY